MSERARPLVLAAPSGTGKTTIARRLVNEGGNFVFSVSATTRPPRAGERDGVDYHFVDRPTFEAMVGRGEMAEWAEVHGRLYGTPRANLDHAASSGLHAVLDIDVQGAGQIRETFPEAVRVFVLPPSGREMVRRIGLRATEDGSEIARRLRSALRELGRAGEFHHVVINEDLDRAVARVRELVKDSAVARRPEDLDERVRGLKEEIREILSDEFAETTR
ncbi:MAG TPA: guanylate kinase [Longimicrobiales bacterium]|nr:guanylate kinase [Longimicrobiales bacterium]